MATATKVSAKYKGHVVHGQTSGDGAKLISWDVPEGSKAPSAKLQKPIIGVEFETWGKAGRAALDAVTDYMGIERLPSDRRMVFYAENAARPINSRDVSPAAVGSKVTKAKAKAKQEPLPEAEDEEDETPADPKAAKVKSNLQRKKDAAASRKPGAVTTRKEGEAAAATKSGRSRSKPAAAVESDDDGDAAGEELDI